VEPKGTVILVILLDQGNTLGGVPRPRRDTETESAWRPCRSQRSRGFKNGGVSKWASDSRSAGLKRGKEPRRARKEKIQSIRERRKEGS